MRSKAISLSLLLLSSVAVAQLPLIPSTPVEETKRSILQGKKLLTDPLSNFRLFLKYDSDAASELILANGKHRLPLPVGKEQTLDLSYEHIAGSAAVIHLQRLGDLQPNTIEIPGTLVRGGDSGGGEKFQSTAKVAKEDFPMNGDFTVMVKFKSKGDGTLFAKTPAKGKWEPNGKTFFIRGGKLVYDIGWLGDVKGRTKVSDNKEHTAVLRVIDGNATIFLDGKEEAGKADFSAKDDQKHIIKIGSTATNFGGDLKNGEVNRVMFWKRGLDGKEIVSLTAAREKVNTPDFHWTPGNEAKTEQAEAPQETSFGAVPGFATTISIEGNLKLAEAWVQPLEKSNHQILISQWNDESFERGKTIYQQLCVTCHGTPEKEGSIPLSLKFHEGEFKNGHDPYRMYQTLTKGYGLMTPMPQYSTRQKYDVIHYIREEFIKPANAKQYFETDEAYLAALPLGMTLIEEKEAAKRPPQYELMDFGNVLFGTYQIEPGAIDENVNIAQKGIAIRLDSGPGGVSKGKAWAVYDHDTMRMAAFYTGDKFVDWKGIDFDGSHGTHTNIVGKRILTTPDQPGWANPKTGKWDADRTVGKDGRKFGPIPRDWAQYKGLHLSSDGPILQFTVGESSVFEVPSIGGDPGNEILIRRIFYSPADHKLNARWGKGDDETLQIAEENLAEAFVQGDRGSKIEVHPGIVKFTYPTHPPVAVKTQIQRGKDQNGFATDILTAPDGDLNPHQSWMRLSGVDFYPDGKRAAVCTWMGDVWIVEGIDQLEGELTWKRICSGLFQPLGLKIVDGSIFVTCRDQLAKLHDKNGDETIDFIECFNNDHQVTEHFHEFAMGLQTDVEGNFYYAKSARHAKTALVPHHGTLLRISKDGSKTDILASGFRAANGVCLNPDGTFIVTDQEGHWNPKNRINWVNGEGPDEFFGNIYGYTPVTDESNDAMTPPLCWITNAFDRSPSELLWVPENAGWGSLNGMLLNLSYGYGKVYVVPHEEVNGQKQGGMCELPIEQFPTGVMRGRFHPKDGQLYACGMFAWGSNQKQAGGLYRVRKTESPAHLPTKLEAKNSLIRIQLSDPVDFKSASDIDNFQIEVWDLLRSKNYGSKHLNERELKIKSATVSEDRMSIDLVIPNLKPTWGMSIHMSLRGANGIEFDRLIHNTVHHLGK